MEIQYNNNNLDNDNIFDIYCIICMDIIGNNKLCMKCKYLYCNECAKKINYKCCICERFVKKAYYNDDYNFYYIEFETTIGYSPLFYLLYNLFSIFLIFICLVGIYFYLKKIFNFIFFILFIK